MFTSKELILLKLDYFKTVMLASDVCELESKNGDHWIILKVQNHISKTKLHNVKHFNYTYQVYHRHQNVESFHRQLEYANLLDVILEIINHDDYRLKHKGKTFFDTVLEQYAEISV